MKLTHNVNPVQAYRRARVALIKNGLMKDEIQDVVSVNKSVTLSPKQLNAILDSLTSLTVSLEKEMIFMSNSCKLLANAIADIKRVCK